MSESSPLEVHVLASGSKGNCTVIKKGNSVILHDVGISCRRIVNGLKELHIDMSQGDGIFISHEHTDHIAVSYTHIRAHETRSNIVCRLLREKKKKKKQR